MDALDYGRRFTVDAFGPSVAGRAAEGPLGEYVSELFGLLEPRTGPAQAVTVTSDDGESGAIAGAETHVALHLFPALGTVTLQVMSRRDILLSRLTGSLSTRFGTGRFESHLGNVTKALPKEQEALRRVVSGDRDYARIRLDDRSRRG